MKIRVLAIMALLAGMGNAFAYTPPAGIPDPSSAFGWQIDRATPSWPAQWLAATPSDASNCYYIDKTHPNSTNTSNPLGNPQKPRKSFPEDGLAAGAFVYVHAGVYTTTDSAGPRLNWYGAGTSVSPIWITGNPGHRPIIQDQVQIGDGGSASYFIFENFEISGTTAASLSVRPQIDGHNIDHVLIRNILRIGTKTASDTSGINVSLSSTSDTIPNSTVADVAIYNCVIHSVGDKASSDDAGVYVGYHTSRTWVLDCQINNVGSDSVQAGHYSNYTTKLTENLYIGRNSFHSNGENGIDLKVVDGFVISENVIYGPFTREQGWAVVLHYGASSSFHARNGAIVFNDIYHCSGGIYTGFSSGADNLDVIGNQIWDIKRAYAATSANENGACLMIGGTTAGANSTFRIVDNTFHDYERGLLLEPSAGDAFKIHGNIFSSKANPAYHELDVVNGLQSYVTLNYNLYHGTPSFFWGNVSRTLAYMQSTAGQEANGVSGDPLFVNAAVGSFQLSSALSAAVDQSVEGPAGDSAYAAFQARFGVAIVKDANGGTRPVNGFWDVGAQEYDGP